MIEALDASTIYAVPLLMRQEKLDEQVLAQLHLPLTPAPNLASWQVFLNKLNQTKQTIRIGLVGKYTAVPDAYKSIHEALTHAGAHHACQVDLQLISFEELYEDNTKQLLALLHEVLLHHLSLYKCQCHLLFHP